MSVVINLNFGLLTINVLLIAVTFAKKILWEHQREHVTSFDPLNIN